MKIEDIVGGIPPTAPRDRAKPVLSHSTDSVQRFVLNLRDIAATRYVDLEVPPCDWLRVQSTVLVGVHADGKPITPVDYQETDAASQVLIWGPEFDAIDRALLPSLDFVVRRPVKRLTLILSPDYGADVTADELPGAVVLYIGSGAVERVGLGLPVSHITQASGGEAGTSATIQPIRISLHGGASPGAAGGTYVPFVTDITGIALAVNWTGAAGNITSMILQQSTTTVGSSFELGRWYLQQSLAGLFADVDFQTPVRVYPHQHVENGGGSIAGSLTLLVGASLAMDSVTATLRCKSWM